MYCCVPLQAKRGWSRLFREMREYLFVYGTLRTGLRPNEVAPLLSAIKLVGSATVRGRLYDLGEYPGVVLEEGCGLVIGELLEMSVSPTPLSALDSYEGVDERAIS